MDILKQKLVLSQDSVNTLKDSIASFEISFAHNYCSTSYKRLHKKSHFQQRDKKPKKSPTETNNVFFSWSVKNRTGLSLKDQYINDLIPQNVSNSLTSILPLLNIVSKIPDQPLGAIIEMAKSWYCYRRAQESGVFPGFQTAGLLSRGGAENRQTLSQNWP